MTDIVTIGDATLYHGDCLEILPTLEKVDAVVTSPPYNQIPTTSSSGMYKDSPRKLHDGYESHSDDMPESEYQSWMANVVGECIKKCDGLVWVNHKIRYRNKVAIHPLSFLKFPVYSEVIWDRGGSMTLNANKFAPSHEYVYGFGTPNFWDKSFNTKMSVWRIAPAQFKGHPCPFPLDIVDPLISASCVKDGIVLDPFMGSGTTGVACANLGRKFIGIEIERKYFDIACERIEAAYAQGRLFE